MMRLDNLSRGWESYAVSITSGGGRMAVWFDSWEGRAQTHPWEFETDDQIHGFQPAYPPDRTLLGLGWRTKQWPRRDPPLTTVTNTVVVIPYWQILLLGAILPAWRAASWARRKRIKPGRCRRCGYDLRASKDRCPECGEAIPDRDPVPAPPETARAANTQT